MKRVSFGVINFNRLYYLKACTKSLQESVRDYNGVQLICIDDSSIESGTAEYLEELEHNGWVVIDQGRYRTGEKGFIGDNVAHIKPFSEALNILYKESNGDYIVPLQGDSQFVRHNWLTSYVRLMQEREDVGAIMLDAQRKIRLNNSLFTRVGDFRSEEH